jgi:hypothetical protein
MLFVKDSLIPSVTSGNLPTHMTSETRSEINDSEDDSIEIGNYEENSTDGLLSETPASFSSNEFSTPSLKKKCKKRRVEDMNYDPFLKIEQQKLDLIREEQNRDSTMTNNPEYHFLMSLLPYFEKLDALEKLQLRANIQNVVFQTLQHKEIEKERAMMYIPPQTISSQKETYHQFPQNTGQNLSTPNMYTQNIYN